ncbi:MAG: hypothetical protein KDK78_00635, partial [Chlamydiia bacterium]|nr:hypothetical protein [Chlamydiia bacterium]
MRNVDAVTATPWITSYSQESSEVHLTQEKVEQQRAALLNSNAEPLDHKTSVELPNNSLAFIRALASLKNTHDATAINEQLASGLETQSTRLMELAKVTNVDLGPFLLLSNDQGRLIAILDKRSDEDIDELVASAQDKIAYCLRASGSPAALACL